MNVRAKFKVEYKMQTTAGFEVKMVPVTGGSTENEQFFKYTPYGEIKIGTINGAAAEQFVPGATMYVDFTAE